MRIFPIFLILTVLFSFGCQNNTGSSGQTSSEAIPNADTLRNEQENHLQNIKQLTFGGDNAEAYFSFDNQYLVFQSTRKDWEVPCDQIFVMPAGGYPGDRPPMVSTGLGRTTCAYFMPGDSTVLYASTHIADSACPETPRVVQGKYVWPVYESFDIFVSDLKGNIVDRLTNTPGYDAEATLSPDGSKIVFTSIRSGDLELYIMDSDGSNLRQITDELGYDGGAFFSPDGSRLIWRASRPQTEEEVDTYRSLLAEGLVQPSDMELFVGNVDGTDIRQITDLGGANWAPYFHPSGKKVLFASNHHVEGGRRFNLFSIQLDGSGLEQITFDDTFDAFPMFSYNGKKLVFASNRNNGDTRDTNIFIADWVD